MRPVLVDSGFIVALLDRRDRRHAECRAAIQDLSRAFVTCEAVISESCYLLRRVPGASLAVVANVDEGTFEVPFRFTGAVSAIRAIMLKYRDVPADFADACLIHMADELDTGDILTLDSDFISYRWRRTRPFQPLIPLLG